MTEEDLGSSVVEQTVRQGELPAQQPESVEQVQPPSIQEVMLAKAGLATLMDAHPQGQSTPEVEKVIELAALKVAEMESALDKARVEAGYAPLNELLGKMSESRAPSPVHVDEHYLVTSLEAQAERVANGEIAPSTGGRA